ncbi:hypothetical protein AOQ84DRAFT_443968 [Glonium stellatum]|uniref:Uncharacterized protein n=1 Tax=Glonium stellatum TaxID=574774 RepID=A0A8E2EMQ9_9PEZI|nr:hypothetical protein AOQ84DRAFT_443968 [Glonium stellatum]
MKKFKSIFHRKNAKAKYPSSDPSSDPPVQSSSYRNPSSRLPPHHEVHQPTGTQSQASSLAKGRNEPQSQKQSTLKSAAHENSPLSPGRSSKSFSSRNGNNPNKTASPTKEHAPHLPPVKSFSDLSSDIEHKTLGDCTKLVTGPRTHQRSEDVADRNIGRYESEEPSGDTSANTGENHYNISTVVKGGKRINEDASYDTFNEYEGQILPAPYPGAFQSPQYQRQEAGRDLPKSTVLSKAPKPENPPTPRSHSGQHSPAQHPQPDTSVTRPLRTDSDKVDAELADLQPALDKSTSKRPFIPKDQTKPPSPKDVFDLNNTTDTDVRKRWAPAVTHETIHPHVHHIREERISREIHNHDVYHRILPVVDVAVLPARHFVPAADGGLVEVTEDQLPDCTGENQNWVITERVSKLPSDTQHPVEPRKFTAHAFEDDERDDKRYVTPEGFERRETNLVHSPTLNDMSGSNGQAYAMHFGLDEASNRKPEGVSCQMKEVSIRRKPVHP